MIISDSLPVQLWINGEETFNQKQICGVLPVCYFHPFNATDEITIQLTEEEGDEEYHYYKIRVVDDNDDLLFSFDLEETAPGVWGATFTFEEYSTTSQLAKINLYGVLAGENMDFETAPYGVSPPTDWEDLPAASGDWDVQVDSESLDHAAFTLSGGSPSSYLRQLIDGLSPGRILLIGSNIRSVLTPPVTLLVEFFVFDGDTPTLIGDLLFTANNEVQDFEYFEELLADYTSAGVRVTADGGLASPYIRDFNIETLNLLAYSDLLSVKNDHECTELFRYTNTTDFDGIDYENASPPPIFYLRIPAQFWKEENPQTQEDSELSNGVIVTRRQTIQEKKLCETGYMPPYMHRKFQKVLMHDEVSNGGTGWKKRDPYETESIDNYPLKKASVLLTKYNSVLKNTI